MHEINIMHKKVSTFSSLNIILASALSNICLPLLPFDTPNLSWVPFVCWFSYLFLSFFLLFQSFLAKEPMFLWLISFVGLKLGLVFFRYHKRYWPMIQILESSPRIRQNVWVLRVGNGMLWVGKNWGIRRGCGEWTNINK